MSKTELTKHVEHSLWRQTVKQGVYGCFEMSIGIGWEADGIVDFITYDSLGEFRCYEIKTSVPDFYSQAKLSFKGDFNYYVIPSILLDKLREHLVKDLEKKGIRTGKDNSRIFDERIKNAGIGLITVSDKGTLSVVIKPKRKSVRASMRTLLLESMVRSLHREVNKYYKIVPYGVKGSK